MTFPHEDEELTEPALYQQLGEYNYKKYTSIILITQNAR
jgi:hypothetical protein